MISKLRRRHRWMTLFFLGAVPGVVLVSGIVGREKAPVTAEVPAVVAGVDDWEAQIVPLGRVWEGLGFEVSVKSDATRAQLIVEISAPPLKPDLLLFWSPASSELRASPQTVEGEGHASHGDQLPNGSVLLGAIRETSKAVLDLPRQIVGEEGRLILYSLPYREVVSASQPVDLN